LEKFNKDIAISYSSISSDSDSEEREDNGSILDSRIEGSSF
jgi:hypothetical protein